MVREDQAQAVVVQLIRIGNEIADARQEAEAIRQELRQLREQIRSSAASIAAMVEGV